MTLHWLTLTTTACGCWALSDISCDICISQENIPPKKRGHHRPKRIDGKLTPEANSILCAAISGILGICLLSIPNNKPDLIALTSSDYFSLIFSGTIHFSAYLITLSAYRYTDSTVITPLLQLSAVWMLILSSLMTLFGLKPPTTNTRDVTSILLIFIGGLLPAAKGNILNILDVKFWKLKPVKYCLLAELMVSCYSLFMYRSQQVGGTQSTLMLFALSRIGNFIMCLFYLLVSKSYRSHLSHLVHDTSPYYLMISILGVILSISGIWYSIVSYSLCREPAIINATEGGLQQLMNLGFSLLVKKYGSSSVTTDLISVDDLLTKVVSLTMISVGLLFSF